MIGVKYMSSGKSPSGYGDAARAFIVALFVTGINVTCESIQQTAEKTDYGIPGDLMDRLENRDIPYKVKILHITPDLYPTYMEKGKYHIGHLFWETDRLPKEWIEPCNQMDELWVASSQMADMIRKSGVTTLCTPISQPINVTKAYEKIEPFTIDVPYDFLFYSIFQWIDRKNPKGLLQAYWKAFEGNDKVALLIKTYRVNYTSTEVNLIKNDIRKWKNELNLSHYPKVLLTKNLLSEFQIGKLHGLGNCYINPSSGEGFARPVQEAMLFGKPVISGNNGGITDIMSSQYYCEVSSSLQQVTEVPQIPWYTSEQNWKVLDENALIKQMRYVYENYSEALIKSNKALKYVVNNFNYQTIGNQMKIRLEEINKLI